MQNSKYELRTIEKYFTNKFIQINQEPHTCFTVNDKFAQKVVGDFIMKEIKDIQEKIGDKE